MFVTDLVRNIAWSLRRGRRQLPNADSVLPADAVSPVAPARSDRRRSTAQETLEDRVRQPGAKPRSGTADGATDGDTPAEQQGQPHIDVKV